MESNYPNRFDDVSIASYGDAIAVTVVVFDLEDRRFVELKELVDCLLQLPERLRARDGSPPKVITSSELALERQRLVHTHERGIRS